MGALSHLPSLTVFDLTIALCDPFLGETHVDSLEKTKWDEILKPKLLGALPSLEYAFLYHRRTSIPRAYWRVVQSQDSVKRFEPLDVQEGQRILGEFVPQYRPVFS